MHYYLINSEIYLKSKISIRNIKQAENILGYKVKTVEFISFGKYYIGIIMNKLKKYKGKIKWKNYAITLIMRLMK